MEEYLQKFMIEAIKEAKKAEVEGEVPIGAVIVKNGKIIARARNTKNKTSNSINHAEILVLNRAMKKLNDWHLNDCDLFVTLEPCPMCAGACINARVGRVIFGALDPKAGCCGTLYNLCQDKRFNHNLEVIGGVCEEECGKMLSDFFKNIREGKR
ncbi:MAG: nucleoside deaminase [Clostridia bacterium]|nr:nucleoside deaminase [Clostridia bacterium]